ncbi:MAG: hypothetical protein JKY54_10575 [Flavobacteriales bacterium]|nr:hypothetical protein [Flavobacteriales bacterium]
MKRTLLFALATLCTSSLFAQFEGSSFTSTGRGGATTFATDYQAVGINPANLGWEYAFDGKKVAMGFNEMTYSIHSEALTRDELRESFMQSIKNKADEFTYQQKIDAAKDFANSGLAFNADLGSIGFSFMTEKFGGIAFRVNDRIQWFSRLGDDAADLLFKGRTSTYFDQLTYVDSAGVATIIANHPNLDPDSAMAVVSGVATSPRNFSDLLYDTRMTMSWTREYNLSYGRKLVGIDSTFMLFGGIGVKFLHGMAYLEIEGAETGQPASITAFSATSPTFGIDYGSAALTNPSAILNPANGLLPQPVGKGWGFDFGLNAVIGNKLKIGVAVTNIGSITWDGNVYSAQDTLLYDSQNAGLESYNIFQQLGDIIGEDGLLAVNGIESKTVKLPTMVRAGASIRFGKKIEVGCDLLLPTNTVPGSLEGALFGLGADITPIKWLNLSGGFVTGGNYDFQIPVGITVIAGNGGWEAGIASRDAITFFTKNGPTLSLSMGFMRFRF